MTEQLLQRPRYTQQLQQLKGSHLLKILVGPARSGKASLLELFRAALQQEGVAPSHCLTFNFSDWRQDTWHDPKALLQTIEERVRDRSMHYVFLREVQQLDQCAEVLNSLVRHDNLDLYVTSSSSDIFNIPSFTLLSGRYVHLEVLPLSFSEFHSAPHHDQRSPIDDFADYLKVGTWPALTSYRADETFQRVYYSDYLHSLLVRIAQRYPLRHEHALERLLFALTQKIGHEVSAKKLAADFQRQHCPVSFITIGNYLDALLSNGFGFRVPRWDVYNKRALRSQAKFYLSDPGFIAHLTGAAVLTSDTLLENIVYLELRRRYSEVFVGKTADQEIDFVVRTADGFAYYQVAYSVMDPTTLDRELRAFESLRDGYPRFLLTMDTIGRGRNFDGAKQLNVLDWLLEEH